MSRRAAVFLDRDGVLNRAPVRDGVPRPPSSAAELELLDGVADACGALRSAGFTLVVVTNQPDVARGTQTAEAVERLNRRLRELLPLDDVLTCLHDDADRCACRKPAPGLLVEAARRWEIDLSASYMVGDRWRDVEAGRKAGCSTVFVDRGYAERRPESPDAIVRDLSEAAEWILTMCDERASLS